MIIEKLVSFRLPIWNTIIYTTFSFSPNSIFQWFFMTYTHFILILRHSNRCDKMAGCHPDARTREMAGSSGSVKAHAVHSHCRCPTRLRMGRRLRTVQNSPPHNFPLSLLGTGLYLSIETGLCCSLQYSFLCLPSSRITSTLFQSISRFFPLIISIFANNVLT